MTKTNTNKVVYVICVIAGAIVGALGTIAVNGTPGNRDMVVAKFNGQSVRSSEVFEPVKAKLFELEEETFRTKEQAINDFIDQKLLQAESKKQNLSVEQLVDRESGAKAEVTEKDIEAFLNSRGIKKDDPRVRKEDVREYIQYQGKMEKRQSYLARLRQGADVKMLITGPVSPKLTVDTNGYPSWGNTAAPVTMVIFSDFQCPFCSRALPVIERIKKEYGPEKVRMVFRDMPLPSHDRAFPAALAAHCANDQGKFWELHDLMFENQGKLQDSDLKSYAKKVGADEAKFNECFDKKQYQAVIEKSQREAQTLGINATPSFVINGTLLQGALPFERFKEKIDQAARG